MEKKIQEALLRQFFKERMKNRQNGYLHPSYALERKMMEAIKRGNTESALQALNEINNLQRAKLADHPIRSLKNSLICSCTLFTRAIIQGGVHPEIAYNLSDVMIQEIERLDSKEALENFEYSMICTFIDTLKKEAMPVYHSIVQRAIEFIHDHILQDLSLKIIAEKLYVHPSYLSNRFKQETGLTITDYINRKRLEESKFFLIHSELPIAEISHLFRFCNQSYYTRLFKKIFGMTPKKFRELAYEESFWSAPAAGGRETAKEFH
jgi:YesN/AraC family two-component response regulator